jgi:glutamate synthase domain-containing protein 1/glutamate synthase domain-containing protein 3
VTLNDEAIRKLIRSRAALRPDTTAASQQKVEAEGGCGVIGLACTQQVRGRHILVPCGQMHNRGNGKGGGLAAAGLRPEQMGVDAAHLRTDYLIQIALLDPAVRDEVTAEFIEPVFEIHAGYRIPTIDDYRDLPGLEVKPPDVWRYFARVREDVLRRFIEGHGLSALSPQAAEDEYVSQWAFRFNSRFYKLTGASHSLGGHVLSYGRDMLVLKIVGYAEDALRYYKMEDVRSHVWIGHQRYPTKGRVWHPGGAHPFTALDVALVHNGDFANYHAVSEYLAQRNLFPLFLTDTEVSVLLFDLWSRTYGYPMEYLIEAMAPTTERDFVMLPEEKQRVYRAIQAAHIHGSPDGPWFFIIARSLAERGKAAGWQLLGITDTSMLRPQVFALQEGEVSIGVIASEKQAIDATLGSLSHEDARICPIADRYWNARGGSYTDGGAFMFTVTRDGKLACTNKFGIPVQTPPGQQHRLPVIRVATPASASGSRTAVRTVNVARAPHQVTAETVHTQGVTALRGWNYDRIESWLGEVRGSAGGADAVRGPAVEGITRLIDARLPTGAKKRSSVLALLHTALYGMLRDIPVVNGGASMQRVDWSQREMLTAPVRGGQSLVVDARGFPSEGGQSLARFLVRAYHQGWKSFVIFDVHGQRFIGNGFGPDSAGVQMDVYGSSGDYLASGLDGMQIVVHNDGQDQIGQIVKAGKIVIHGSVGQTLLYGAKGGEIFILGSAAGRPLINAVGRPRVVINGTALDYLAESFMAGDPLDGGGFCILNGVAFDADGSITDLDTPYPGGNLFSLASGGAIYARDPLRRLDEEQLNGGQYADLTDNDWQLILPYLQENERLFNIPVERLLTVDGRRQTPQDVYRKIAPIELSVLK